MSEVLSGARQGNPSWLGRLVSRAAAGELSVCVVPGPEVARARGLDLEAAGLMVTSTPRHASVLLVVGELPEGLRRAAAVAYAQMPRPRAVFAVGAGGVSPLPGPDVSASPEQDSLAYAVSELRRLFAEGAFAPETDGFEAAVLQSKTEYVCPMHPDVVQEEPGTCPKCGMELVPREAGDGGESTDHGHGGHDHASHDEKSEAEDTEQGGGDEGHGGHEGMDHGDMDFMSMIEMTQGTPRSSDGLQMEWVEAPFGPLLPGLPGGLVLTFTLDGDTVAEARAGSAADRWGNEGVRGPVAAFADRVSGLDPLAPAAYRLLALRAVEDAVGIAVDEATEIARAGALERERAGSHLNWLASFAHLVGYQWLARRAEELQLATQRADAADADRLRAELGKLVPRIERTPLLRRRLEGIGVLQPADVSQAAGPVARAGGIADDARADEEAYRGLGFEPVVREGGDALARLRVRLAETEQSLGLAHAAGAVVAPEDGLDVTVSGSATGTATVETPRGSATLTVTLEEGSVSSAELRTPSEGHLRFVESLTLQREVADALVGVASLDLSPWEILWEEAG